MRKRREGGHVLISGHLRRKQTRLKEEPAYINLTFEGGEKLRECAPGAITPKRESTRRDSGTLQSPYIKEEIQTAEHHRIKSGNKPNSGLEERT